MLTYAEYAAALYDALLDDPFYRTLADAYPDHEGTRDAMLRYYDLSIREGAKWGRIGEAEGVRGVSVWSIPLSAPAAEQKKRAKDAGLRAVMGDGCAAVFSRICSSMKQQEASLDLAGMWYLSILGLAPSQRGRGLGGQLLASVLAEADAAGVASYLTTFSPGNIRFYEGQGYAIAGRFPEPETGSEFTVLVRPVAGS